MKQWKLTLEGNTYAIKGELKVDGFRWNPSTKSWFKIFDNRDRAEVMLDAYENSGYGISATVEEFKETKYRVKESWIFNLESMHDKLWCIIYDMRDGECDGIEIAGKQYKDEDAIMKLIDEADDLEGKAKFGKVTGKEYGRIKQLVEWRVMVRYARCIASGMDESRAGMCFEDM